MASFHNWTGDELIDTQVPQFLNEDNVVTQEKLDTKFNNSLKITVAADLNNFKDEGFYYCNSNSQAETILNCPTNYAFGLMVWGKEDIFYQEVREFNRGSNQDYNNCWRRSYYFDGGQGVWSNWQRMSYAATTLAGYGITDGMSKNATNSVSVADILKRDINTSYLRLTGGKIFDKGANLQLCGGAYIENAGQFLLNAADSTKTSTLLGSPSGLLKWKNKNIVRSVNNIVADENGNVSINVSGGGGSGSNITVDAELSSTSTNPVQNKVIKEALDNKLSKTEVAAAAIKDGAGNNIVETYAKFGTANTWTAQQNFHDLMFNRERYTTYGVNGTSDTPTASTMLYTATGAFTLNLATLTVALRAGQSSVFTAYFAANADYTLTITNAGTIKYIGSASGVAITSAGLLLNIMMLKDNSGNLTSIVQASNLS